MLGTATNNPQQWAEIRQKNCSKMYIEILVQIKIETWTAQHVCIYAHKCNKILNEWSVGNNWDECKKNCAIENN